MHQDELPVLRRGTGGGLAQFLPARRTVDEAHGDGLALGLAHHKAVAPGEPRRLGARALELVHRLALGQLDLADLDRETALGDLHLDRHGADAQFAHEGMGAPVAALRGIGQARQEPLVAARQRLQAQRAAGGQVHRLARQVGRGSIARGNGLHPPVAVQQARDARGGQGAVRGAA